MPLKLAINGFGRIGRAVFKIILENERGIDIVAINDLGDNGTLAHLLKYDTVYGKCFKDIKAVKTGIVVDGKEYKFFSEKDPANLPWKKFDVDVVLECTGFFTEYEKAIGHIKAGAKRVIISAPSKSKEINAYVMGVNDHKISKKEKVISSVSCTTNCISPVMKVMEDNFGIKKALMTTVHSYTSSQKLVDSPCKNLREARAAAENLIPALTGAAIATTKVLPILQGKFDGMAVRVPTPVGSLSDITALLKKKVNEKIVNQAFTRAAKMARYKNILTTTDDPIVSSDIIKNPFSAIVDLSLTKVVDNNLVKIIAWYDNEWGYANRLVELAIKVGG